MLRTINHLASKEKGTVPEPAYLSVNLFLTPVKRCLPGPFIAQVPTPVNMEIRLTLRVALHLHSFSKTTTITYEINHFDPLKQTLSSSIT
jgi:hypothetical protein